jgi:hypothetical protein
MTDKELIRELGGPTKLAVLLGYDKTQGGVQRVQNWISRGIPPQVKLDFPHIFLTPFGGASANDGSRARMSEAIDISSEAPQC